MENIVREPEQTERIFSDEMRAKIIEREKEIERNPDAWRDAFEVLEEIRKSI